MTGDLEVDPADLVDGKARQQGVAELRAQRIADQSLYHGVVRKLAQIGELVDPVMGAAVPTHFLQADHVGIDLLQDREDATHVEVVRSEEHTSELQSLMRISYAVFCLKNK